MLKSQRRNIFGPMINAPAGNRPEPYIFGKLLSG